MQIRFKIQPTNKIVANDKVVNAIFDFCEDCSSYKDDMSQGAFAAKKVRQNMEKCEYIDDGRQEHSHYNSKYMNSIWGMYNRFSVHNLKKIMDDKQSQANLGQAVKGLAASSNLSVSVERLSYLPL